MNIDKKDSANFFKSRQIASEAIEVIKTKSPYNSKYGSLNDYFLKNRDSGELVEILLDREKLRSLCENYERKEKYDGAIALNVILSNRMKKRRLKARFIGAISSAAAVVAILCVILFNGSEEQKSGVITNRLQSSSSPVLILASGENIILVGDKQLAVGEGEIEVLNNKLTYKNGGEGDGKVLYNTIIVPDKCTYRIQLEDSTEVILNENSELRYPTKFAGASRDVFLKGEGYFVVSKMVKPFIVNSSGVMIRVYGTQFNVNARDSSAIRTALIEGSVGVTVSASKEIMLKPNEMITINMVTKSSDIREVDASRYVAWTLDCLRYDSERLETILKELTYWYGVEFVFANEKNRDEILTASLFKDTNLETIVELLSGITNLTFTREGGKYIVK